MIMINTNRKRDSEECEYVPEWVDRAKHLDYKPEWVDAVPHRLWCLGEVFFPIPNRQKYREYPFHIESYRFSPDDEIFNAYMESGANYGIVCAGDLAVVDIDDDTYLDYITDKLPETIWQKTGSGDGYHLFYLVEGLDNRINLFIHTDTSSHMAAEGIDARVDSAETNLKRGIYKKHIGEVKCDEHGYVVGPGSVHPSGNEYGPLKGEEIERISRERVEHALHPFIYNDYDVEKHHNENAEEYDKDDYKESKHDFYELTADDVLPWLEEEKRISHPVHGSSTGMNFMKNEGGETFTCWRCKYGSGDGCGLSGPQFLAVEETERDCEDIRMDWGSDETLEFHAWRRAVRLDLVDVQPPPYPVIQGFAKWRGFVDDVDDVEGETYWKIRRALEYEQAYFEV